MVNDTYLPGERLAEAIGRGQVDPGKLLFQLAPTLPHESIFPMPRFLLGAQAQEEKPAAMTSHWDGENGTYIVNGEAARFEQPPTPGTAAVGEPPSPQLAVSATPQPVIASSRPLPMDEFTGAQHRARSGQVAIKQFL